MDPVAGIELVETLARGATARPIAWLNFDRPGAVPGMGATTAPTTTYTTVPSLGVITTFGPKGIELQRPIAHLHPHGGALEWIA